MKLNEGTIDRVIRAVAGIALLVIGVMLVKGAFGVVLDVLGAILLITGVMGFCPLYTLFGINTASKS
jgi:uncharacterized membrane protein